MKMMVLELMWVCAIAPEEFRKTVVQLCLAENKTVGLPESVFKLPLHISMKKSFCTDSVDSVKEDVLKVITDIGGFSCCVGKIELLRNMLWLSLINDGELRRLHEELDRLLERKYGIPISRYDRMFQPHMSLFTRGSPEKLQTMYGRLAKQDFGAEIEISRFVIGSSGHKDTFFDLK